MQPADIDPSLCSGEPLGERLDDGFSPPPQEPQPAKEHHGHAPEAALTDKSQF
jgi:hypothetical protein